MITCRTWYKSYREKNTHIHVLYPDRLPEPIKEDDPYAPLVRMRGASVSIDGSARLKGERSCYGSGSSVGLEDLQLHYFQ
jgi:hypothetical protein